LVKTVSNIDRLCIRKIRRKYKGVTRLLLNGLAATGNDEDTAASVGKDAAASVGNDATESVDKDSEK